MGVGITQVFACRSHFEDTRDTDSDCEPSFVWLYLS